MGKIIKSSTSDKKPYRKGKVITLANGEKVEERYHNDYGPKRYYPDKKKDPEDEPAPKDAASKHKYPPPKNDKVFREKWMKFIGPVTERANFKNAHLEALEVLCDMYSEYEQLQKIIRTEGRTFEAVTRFGKAITVRPEVTQIEKVKKEIRAYTKDLDLFPKKDKSVGGGGSDTDKWE